MSNLVESRCRSLSARLKDLYQKHDFAATFAIELSTSAVTLERITGQDSARDEIEQRFALGQMEKVRQTLADVASELDRMMDELEHVFDQ